jgi:hypothetical protein
MENSWEKIFKNTPFRILEPENSPRKKFVNDLPFFRIPKNSGKFIYSIVGVY